MVFGRFACIYVSVATIVLVHLFKLYSAVQLSLHLLLKSEGVRLLLHVFFLQLDVVMHLVESLQLLFGILSGVVELLLLFHHMDSVVCGALDACFVNAVLPFNAVGQVFDESCLVAPEHVELARPVLLRLELFQNMFILQFLGVVGRRFEVVRGHFGLNPCVPCLFQFLNSVVFLLALL